MRFVRTELPEVVEVHDAPHADERGLFLRVWCAGDFAGAGFDHHCAQLSLSRSDVAGTVRGLHFAAPPHAEKKLVRCMRGAIYDVAVDVRPGSSTFGRYVARRLDARNGVALLIPPGFAHGLQTLEPDTEVLYVIDVPYVSDAARAIRYDDPEISITWPLEVTMVSERDRAAPSLSALDVR